MGNEISSLHGVIKSNCSSNQTSSDWFERKQELGSGHFGTVFVCELKDNKREKFALKEISKPKEKEKKDLDNLFEISTAKQLCHPNIIQYYYVHFDVDSSKYLIFMRYAENGSLGQLIRKYGPFHDYLVGKYTKDILNGLAYLHKQGIIHRDIKCDNVLLDVNNTAKLSDFGLAKAMRESVNYFSTRCGTTHFKAPEIGFKRHTLKADIWSIGATVLEMKLGTPPSQLDARFLKDAKDIKPLEVYEDKKKFNFSEDILSFARLCLKTNYKLRPAVEELLEHKLCGLPKGEYFNDERSLVPYNSSIVNNNNDNVDHKFIKVCFKWTVARNKIIHKLKLELQKLIEAVKGRTLNLHLIELKDRDCDISNENIVALTASIDLFYKMFFGISHISLMIKQCLHSIYSLFVKDQRETNELNEQLKQIIDTQCKNNWFEIKEKILQNYLEPSKHEIEVGDLFISKPEDLNQLIDMGYFELCIEECSINKNIDRYSPEFNMYLLKRLLTIIMTSTVEDKLDVDNAVLNLLEQEKEAIDNIRLVVIPQVEDLESNLAESTVTGTDTWTEESVDLQKEEDKLMKRLRVKKLKIIETTKDGNCLFDAVSQQISRQYSAQQLRQMTVENLEQCPEYNGFSMKDAVDENWNTYLRKLKEENAWGDHMCLCAISRILQRPIQVYSSDGLPYDTLITLDEFKNAEPILLGNIKNIHFVLVEQEE